MLCHAAATKGLTTACKHLWDWLCAVGLTANADMRLDILLPISGDRNFCAARRRIQQALLPKDKADATPHAQDPRTNAATVAINKLTKGLLHLSVTNTKTTQTVSTRWPYQLNQIMRLCHVTQPT